MSTSATTALGVNAQHNLLSCESPFSPRVGLFAGAYPTWPWTCSLCLARCLFYRLSLSDFVTCYPL